MVVGVMVVGVVAGAGVVAAAASIGAAPLVLGGVFVVGAGASVAGVFVTAGVVGAVAWPVETAANPVKRPTPAKLPAAIQRVAVAVRAVPWARSRADGRSAGVGGRRRLGGSVGWRGIGFLTTRSLLGWREQVRERQRLGKTLLRAP
jgi:hypothetical protein